MASICIDTPSKWLYDIPNRKGRQMRDKLKKLLRLDIFTLLTIAFIVLKLTGVIDWDWVWVLAPFWMIYGSVLSVVIVILISNRKER